jgi:hypothetical protein
MADEELRASISQPRAWVSEGLADWLIGMIDRYPLNDWSTHARLIADDRMREVWEWCVKNCPDKLTPGIDQGIWLCMTVCSALQLPGKPTNLSLAKRAKYFSDVRRHAQALSTLLQDTVYCSDLNGPLEPIEPDDLEDVVVRDLQSWGEDEMGHVVAYYVDEDSVSRLPWDYPECVLSDLLQKVIEWTHWDDRWTYSLTAKGPLDYAKPASARATFFCCTVHRKFASFGQRITFPLLATLANVALQLPSDAQLDEEAVRKQVRRFEHHEKSNKTSDQERTSELGEQDDASREQKKHGHNVE